MSIISPETGMGEAGLNRLRHDLLNSLNVLAGTTAVLLETELNETQRSCVQVCRRTAERLREIVDRLEQYQREPSIDGPHQLADLCSIAVARVDKPFDRNTLITVVRRLASSPAPRILLVDDAPDIAVLVRAYLKDTNAVVDVVADGERAVGQASSQAYDLVLMDVDLPGLDGATAAHAIRAADLARGARPTPIVAMSAVASRMPQPAADESDDLVVLEDLETAPLVPAFLENRREDVATMKPLLERAEFGRIQSIGHRMKGTGRSYGFKTISRIGADIELAGYRNDARALERLVEELDDYLSRVKTSSPV